MVCVSLAIPVTEACDAQIFPTDWQVRVIEGDQICLKEDAC
jgi:hypothetical protein